VAAESNARPTPVSPNFVGVDPCPLVSFVLGVVREHDLSARTAQPRFIAAQAGDDFADVRDVAAAKPEDVRLACILLHRALRESRTTATDRQSGHSSSNQLDGSQIHRYLL